MDVYPVTRTYEYLVHYVMLIIKIDSGINFIVVAENVCLSGIHMAKKDGNYLIWKQKLSLSLVMYIFSKINSIF